MISAPLVRNNGEYNVCFQGSSLDVGNLGCRALAASFIKLVTDTRPQAKIHLLYGNRTGGVQQLRLHNRTVELDIVNFRLSPKARLGEHLFWIFLLALLQRIMPSKSLRRRIIQSNRWLRTLREADFVGEIRGGDSFSDIYGLRLFMLGILPCIIAILMRKNLVMLPQTYGPYKSAIAKRTARFIMKRAAQLYCRDKASIELINNLLGERAKGKFIRFCPDVAFVLEPAVPETLNIRPSVERADDVPLIGLNVSGLLYVGGYTRDNMFGLSVDYKELISTLLKQLFVRTKAHILLVPHVSVENSDINEISICRSLLSSVDSKYSDRLHMIDQEYNQSEIKGIVGLCDFFIGSRMHACIAALSQGIPAVGLAYSKKFHGVFQSIGAERFVVDLREKELQDVIDETIGVFEGRRVMAEHLKQLIPQVQEQIRDTFKDML